MAIRQRNSVRKDIILTQKKKCHCTPRQIQNYISIISGPLLDRIDIHVEVLNIQYKDMASNATCELSKETREKVTKVHDIQLK